VEQTGVSILTDIKMYGHLAYGLRGFLSHKISIEQARATIRHRIIDREAAFLRMVEQNIFGNPRSPYLSLLTMAGCEFGDLKTLIYKEGLEEVLSRLVEAGVYVTFDEFKGRKDVIRGSQRFTFSEKDFDNPHLSSYFEIRSGGTRGPGTAVKVGLPFITDLAVNQVLALYVQGLSQHDHVIWMLSSGGFFALRLAKLGNTPLAWFYPLNPLSFKLRVGSRCFATLSRLLGCPFPVPVSLDLQDPDRLAVWLTGRLKEGKSICVVCYASSAVRVSAAAMEKGISLTDVCFITLGEPFTEAKRRIIEAVGARAIVQFGFTEAGFIAGSCGNPLSPDDLHFFSDCFGLVQRSREVGESGLAVQAFEFTSLLSSAPKILLNVESGDYGIVERRRCGCGLEALGLRDHISQIRSFEKLSGEGMTFVQTELIGILEKVLPSRYGGTSADYQLVEREVEDGILRLFLIVSPKIGPVDVAKIRETFLNELSKNGGYGQIGAEIWRRAQTVEVSRVWPIATKAGKILPFHLIKGQ
jgi:hypothetical protein